MSRSSQNVRPVIFWISMGPGADNPGDGPADVPRSRGLRRQDAPHASAGQTTCHVRRPGVFIPYRVLQVLAVLVGGGAAGLVVVLRWPQAGAVVGTVCAVIGAGLAVLDIMKRRDEDEGSGHEKG
jgi:hypothetical protein